jgi:hypothetical protein
LQLNPKNIELSKIVKYGKMLTFFWWIGWIGAIMVATGTIGHRIYSNKINTENTSTASSERKGISDKIDSSKEELLKESKDSEKRITEIVESGDRNVSDEIKRVNEQLKEKPVSFEHIISHVTLIQNKETGQLHTLTNYRHREVSPIEFDNYKHSLKYIDRLPNNGSFSEPIDINKYWKYEFHNESKRKLLEYSFWRWMMNFSQSYILTFEAKDTGTSNSRNGTVLDIDKYKIDEKLVPHEENELLKYHETKIFLPKNSKFIKIKDGYEIETVNSKVKFIFSNGASKQIRYKTNSLTKKIFDEFNLNKEDYNLEITFVINIMYERKDK